MSKRVRTVKNKVIFNYKYEQSGLFHFSSHFSSCIKYTISFIKELTVFGYGCCHFDGIVRTQVLIDGAEAKMSLQDCKKHCFDEPGNQCIAIDIATDPGKDPSENKFHCFLSKGSGHNFGLGCQKLNNGTIINANTDPYHRKCYKLNRPGK